MRVGGRDKEVEGVGLEGNDAGMQVALKSEVIAVEAGEEVDR